MQSNKKDDSRQTNDTVKIGESVPTNKDVQTRDLFIGTTLAEKYKMLSLIGGGGVGLVYKAMHVYLERIVAVKVMIPYLTMQEDKVQRFKQEALAISLLDHPNIVDVIDFGLAEKGQPYLVMEYLSGKNLADLINETGGIPVQRAIPIFMQICDAITHAHSTGLIHRDLKPSNIMLVPGPDGKDLVKLIDFGLVKQFTEESGFLNMTQTGDIFGSPHYMSPEQVRGQKVDTRTDIYSMGILMYETLMGSPPFAGDDPHDVFCKQLTADPGNFSKVKADRHIRDCLELIVLGAMAKDPADRCPTMGQIKDDLQILSADREALYKTGTRWKLLALRCKNYVANSAKLAWILVAIASIIIAAAAVMFTATNHVPPVVANHPDSVKPEAVITKSKDSEFPDYYDSLAHQYSNAGKKQEAIAAFKSEVALLSKYKQENSPQMASALFYLGNLLFYQGLFVEAEQDLEKSIYLREQLGMIGGETTATRGDLGSTYAQLGKIQQAESQYRLALTSEKKYPRGDKIYPANLNYMLGSMLGRQGKYSEAVPFLERAIKLEEDNPAHKDAVRAYMKVLADTLAHQGKSAEAESWLRRADKLAR